MHALDHLNYIIELSDIMSIWKRFVYLQESYDRRLIISPCDAMGSLVIRIINTRVPASRAESQNVGACAGMVGRFRMSTLRLCLSNKTW